MKIVSGRVFVVGDDVNTDEIIPARRCATPDISSLGQYALEDLHPAKNPAGKPFSPGQYAILVAGENFGCGSSREVAPIALMQAGIKAIIAKSFARIFYRNAVNNGLVVSRNAALARGASTDDVMTLDLADDALWQGTSPVLRQIIEAGGITAFQKSGKTIAQESAPPRPMTIAEKVLAKAAGLDYVAPGMIVYATVDTAMTTDLVLPVAAKQFYESYGPEAKVWDPKRLWATVDHTLQIPLVRDDPKSSEMAAAVARFTVEQGLPYSFLPPAPFTSPGICHVLFPEKDLVKPDTLLVGTDSHTCTYGAFGTLSIGIGTTDLVETMASGKIWLDVPETALVILEGRLPKGVYAKDVILQILSQVGMNGFTDMVVEFAGPALEHLSQDDRSTIANMIVEAGGTCGLFPVGTLRSDPEATYSKRLTFDLATLEPYVAKPYKPDNAVPVSQVGDVPVDVAWVGSCTGGKLEDIAAVAAVLEGKKVHPRVRLYVSPATLGVMEEAGKRGYLRTILKAGGYILPPACGACLGMGPGVIPAGQVGIFASNRNFKGRAGEGDNYLASPATVAATAVKGKITDPREFL